MKSCILEKPILQGLGNENKTFMSKRTGYIWHSPNLIWHRGGELCCMYLKEMWLGIKLHLYYSVHYMIMCLN